MTEAKSIKTSISKSEALPLTPATGMQDIMPNVATLRDYVSSVILDTYRQFGFERIETPMLEDIRRLQRGDGGENTSLMYKVLRRGDKLKLDKPGLCESDLADLGLRFDLTVPLVRFYCNHMHKLPNPLKAIQIGYAWRAERPQRGRYRQFMQCDIDVIGDAGNWIEAELLTAAATSLKRLSFSDLTVRINDRRILQALAQHCSVPSDRHASLFIALDKLDKIGTDGVLRELATLGFESSSVETLGALLKQLVESGSPNLGEFLRELSVEIESDIVAHLETTISILKSQLSFDSGTPAFTVVFDPTLVRGMGYYTGQIFEIMSRQFGSALGGGGRYDRLVGQSIGKEIPACGFSIGFERITMLLEDAGFKPPEAMTKIALFFENDKHDINEIMLAANKIRKPGKIVSILERPKKLRNKLSELQAMGYSQFAIYDGSSEISLKGLRD